MIQEANLTWQYKDTDCGLIMPWYTLPCLQWLKQQDTKEWAVFEYGAGYSTIWWALNARMSWAVDHSKEWARAMDCEYWFDRWDYVEVIELILTNGDNDDDILDCVIVDGIFRKECLEFAIKWVKSGGYIIIDNWGQEDFPDTEFAEKLLEGWEKQLFKQPNHTAWVTAVFKKP